MTLDLFHCDRFHAELTAKGCLQNQGKGRVSEQYRGCLECEVGRMIRETRGQAPPEMNRNWSAGTINLAENRQTPVVVDQQNHPNAVLKACKNHPNAVLKACKNHPKREAVGKTGMCRECKRIYDREWLRNKKAKIRRVGAPGYDMGNYQVKVAGESVTLPGGNKLAESTGESAGRIVQAIEAAGRPEDDRDMEKKEEKAVVVDLPQSGEKVCSVCRERPRHKNSNRCLECLQAQISDPAHKEKRIKGIGSKSRAAYDALRMVESGEVVPKADRYKAIFDLVPGLEESLREETNKTLRSLEAEMAHILRQALLQEHRQAPRKAENDQHWYP